MNSGKRMYSIVMVILMAALLMAALFLAAHPAYADPPRPSRPNFPALILSKYMAAANDLTPLPNPPPAEDCRPVQHAAYPGAPANDCRPVRHDG